jgi:hypothetical protein
MKLINKLILLILLVGTPLGGLEARPVYLIPENHEAHESKVLEDALINLAKQKKILLAIEAVGDKGRTPLGLLCSQYGVCDLPSSIASKHFHLIDHDLARVTAHFTYIYEFVLIAKAFEQASNCPSSDADSREIFGVYADAILQTHIKDRMADAFWLLWSMAKTTLDLCRSLIENDKKPILNGFIYFIEKLRQKSSIDALRALQLITQEVDSKFADPDRFKALIVELRPFLIKLTQYLMDDEGDIFDQNIKDHFMKTNDLLRAIKDYKVCTYTDLKNFWWSQVPPVDNALADRLRDLYLAKALVQSKKHADDLGLPLVVIIGQDHAVGMYSFLRQFGLEVRVGLSKDTLKLPYGALQTAQGSTLVSALSGQVEVQTGAFPILGDRPFAFDVLPLLEQYQDDPQVVEAIQFIKKHDRAFQVLMRDEL